MKRLSPAKRNQLIGVMLAALALMSGVYFLLIAPQKSENRKLQQQIHDRQEDATKYKEVINEALSASNQLAALTLQLDSKEKDVAAGDVYAWVYDTIHRFKENYHVNIPTISQPTISDVDLIPNFPYKQVRLSLFGTGYYHNIGKFVADFENTFPHMRLVNLAIGATDSADDSELLSFRVEVVALVKPNT